MGSRKVLRCLTRNLVTVEFALAIPRQLIGIGTGTVQQLVDLLQKFGIGSDLMLFSSRALIVHGGPWQSCSDKSATQCLPEANIVISIS